MSDDTISRQAAIAETEKYKIHSGIQNQGTWNECVSTILETLRELPSAEPQERKGKWIPCSERLPEKNGGYLATEKFSNYFPPQTNILYFAKNLYAIDKYDFATKRGEAGFYSHNDELGYIFTDCVIAWMPLPEPYREESNEHQG